MVETGYVTGVVERNAVKLGAEEDKCDLRLDSSVNTCNIHICIHVRMHTRACVTILTGNKKKFA